MQRDYFKRELLTNRQLCQELVTAAQLSAPTNGQAAAKVKAVSDALQPTSGELEEPEGKTDLKKIRHRTEMNQNLNCLKKLHLKLNIR